MKWYERVIYWQLMLIVSIGLQALWAFPMKWAWNYTMTYVFGLPEISWLHAFLIMFIISYLWKLNIVTVDKEDN